jgi:hypothetical protein
MPNCSKLKLEKFGRNFFNEMGGLFDNLFGNRKLHSITLIVRHQPHLVRLVEEVTKVCRIHSRLHKVKAKGRNQPCMSFGDFVWAYGVCCNQCGAGYVKRSIIGPAACAIRISGLQKQLCGVKRHVSLLLKVRGVQNATPSRSIFSRRRGLEYSLGFSRSSSHTGRGSMSSSCSSRIS